MYNITWLFLLKCVVLCLNYLLQNDDLMYTIKPNSATPGTETFFSLRQSNGLLSVASDLELSRPTDLFTVSI